LCRDKYINECTKNLINFVLEILDLDNASRSGQPVEVDDDTSQTIKITHVI